MIKVENIDVWGFEHAIRGMRNPMQSHDKSDSEWESANFCDATFIVGDDDLSLMHKLYKAGSSHRKFMRQLFVSMDIIAPDYFFKEFSTYKVGVVENSTSTMHKIHSKEFTPDDFSHEHLENFDGYYNKAQFHEWFIDTIEKLNIARQIYLDTGDKRYWWQMIQLLPMSYNYKRTITMNYENAANMINQRTGHKLDEWDKFITILQNELPYLKEIMEDGK